jgi:hypothetical protein
MKPTAAPASTSRFITISYGLRGYFAVLADEAGPLLSSEASYPTAREAYPEACEWALSEGLPLPPPPEGAPTPERASRGVGQRCYAGIGSRETPSDVLTLMRDLGAALARRGYVLRSGGAQGADSAFEAGALDAGGVREIFIPWTSFGDRAANDPGTIIASTLPKARDALTLASQCHPAWTRLSPAAQKLHARNAHQVLGRHLDDPVAFVVCWARHPTIRDDKVVNVDGGTGLAVRLAHARGIPIFHLGLDAHRVRIEAFLATTPQPLSTNNDAHA